MTLPTTGTMPLTKRLTRPGWRDPRLGVGLLLLAGSVALGAWSVDTASTTDPVFAARHVLTPGDPVSAADLVVVEANTAAPAGTYLTPQDAADGVVLRAVGAGELVPAGAVAPAATLDRRPLVLDVEGTLPAAVVPAAVVELWLAPEASVGSGEPEQPPALVAADLEVSRVDQDSSMLGGGMTTAVEVLVPVSDVSAVIEAKASGGHLVVVPVRSAGRAPAAADEGDPTLPEQTGVGPAEDAGPGAAPDEGER